jgi:preprotein translocase subunit SecA
MRVFGGDNFKNILGKLGLRDDQPIENKMITRSLEGAQEKIEGFNFDARKHILEFDDVLNFQRKIMYARRNAVLRGSDSAVKEYLAEVLLSAEEEEKEKIEKLLAGASTDYLANIRRVILQTIDMFWIDHLEMMDYMRSSVNLRAYGQRDPLVEYKREGLKLFKDMEFSIGLEIIKLISQIGQQQINLEAPIKLSETREGDTSAVGTVTSNIIKVADTRHATPDGKKIGRNDPCWCGSNKKFKHCHGKNE